MKTLFRTSVSALAFSAASTAALAQDDVIILQDVIVSANTTPTAAQSTGSVVEVIDTQEITSQSPTKLADGLARLSGVSASANGGFGTSTNLRIRGLSSQYVAVRINGIDISDPSNPQTQFDWGALYTAGLGRAEVLKGSQSALYGSEAIGGVVSLYSKEPEFGTTAEVGLEFGSYDTLRADTTIATRGERGQVSLTLSSVTSEGFSAAEEADGNTESDGYDGVFALLSTAVEATDALTLGVDVIYQDEATNIDAFGGVGGDADRPFYTDRRGLRAYARYGIGAWTHEIAASLFETERRDPLTPFGSGIFVGERTEVSYRAVGEFGPQTLTFGAEYSEEQAQFDNGTFDYSVASVFGEYQGQVGELLDYSAALRIDDHSEFGTETTGRFAVAYRPGPGTVIRAALGSGFRAPSLNELFGPFNISGAPTLEPETSRSFELGISHDYGADSSVQATLFYTEIDNLIAYPVSGYEQVPGTSITQGLELGGKYALSNGVVLFGAYTYTDAQDANGNQLRRVPEHDLVLGIDADLTDRLSASLSAQHIAGRADDGFPSVPMADYTVVNASAAYQVRDNVQVYLRIENLTDEQYQTTAGYGTSGRAAYFGIRAAF
jgi:vitamin B12 transporter